MDYQLSITVPPLTQPEEPAYVAVRIPQGTITAVRVFIPWGVAGLAGVRLKIDEQQVYPSNLDGWYTGNDNMIVVNDKLTLTETFQTLKVEGYNLDDTYEHTIYVGVTVLAPEEQVVTPAFIGFLQSEEY